MSINKIKEILKNKKVMTISGAIAGALIIAVAGTTILHNKNIVEDKKQESAILVEDNVLEKQVKAQLEKLRKIETDKLSEEDKQLIEKQIKGIEEIINKKEYDKAKKEIDIVNKSIESKLKEFATKDEDKKEETIKEEKETDVKEENNEVVSNTPENSTSGNTVNTNTNNNQSNAGNTSNNTTPLHSHNWNPITEVVYHDEVGHWEDIVISEAWTEEIPVYDTVARDICNGCGLDITDNVIGHIESQVLAGKYECGGHHTEWKQVQVGTNTVNQPAVTEKKWIVDKSAWNETVTKGYNCSCGATK